MVDRRNPVPINTLTVESTQTSFSSDLWKGEQTRSACIGLGNPLPADLLLQEVETVHCSEEDVTRYSQFEVVSVAELYTILAWIVIVPTSLLISTARTIPKGQPLYQYLLFDGWEGWDYVLTLRNIFFAPIFILS